MQLREKQNFQFNNQIIFDQFFQSLTKRTKIQQHKNNLVKLLCLHNKQKT